MILIFFMWIVNVSGFFNKVSTDIYMDYYNLIFLCAIWVLASLEYSLDLKTDFYYLLFPGLGGLFKFCINVQQNTLMAVK